MRYVMTFSMALWCVSAWAQTGTQSTDKLEWESRAIIGWHQAGASSADFEQNVFIDFFVARPLGSGGPIYDSRMSLWGQVRVASSAQQRTIPLSQFAAGFVDQLGGIPVNELAQGAEFLTGVEARTWGAWNARRHVRTLGLVAFFGANGAFKDATTQAKIFRVPPPDSPQWVNFTAYFPEFNAQNDPNGELRSKATLIALVPPDRERFYRQYGAGVRYSSYRSDKPEYSPSTFTATIGQDQSITRGRYVGPVLKFDAFYPLPISESSIIYLFGTANLAVARPYERTPLALEPITDPNVKPYQNNVTIHAVPSSRDTYRIGVGVDVIGLLRHWTEK